jgi:hypothetical protein
LFACPTSTQRCDSIPGISAERANCVTQLIIFFARPSVLPQRPVSQSPMRLPSKHSVSVMVNSIYNWTVRPFTFNSRLSLYHLTERGSVEISEG